MKVKRAGTELSSRPRRARRPWLYAPAPLALGAICAIVFAATFFAAANTRADGPPDLGSAITLPFKLEQGRPAPAPASPGAQPRATIPAPAPTPSALESNQAPDPPTGVNAYPLRFNVIEVEWAQPQGNVDGFEVQVSEDGSTWRLLASKARLTDPAGRLYTWTQQHGLQGNQTRHYRVRAGNGDNWSAWSTSVSATTLATSPPSLSVAALGETSVKISWEMPSAYATVTGWELEVTSEAPEPEYISFILPIGSPGGYLVRQPLTSDNRPWTRVSGAANLAAETRTYTHTGLQPGSSRYYRVRAVTDVGTAPWSEGNAHGITHRGPIPEAPKLTARANGRNQIVLNWTRGDGPNFTVTTYEFQDSPDGNRWYDLFATLGSNTRQEVRIERPGTTWYYRIRAESDGVFGPWSQAASATTENGTAGEPGGLKLVDAGTTWIELAWNAAEKGDSPITGYRVQRSPKGYVHNFTTVGRTSASTLTFRDTGLQPGSGYHYRVAALDSGGLGPWSSESAELLTIDLPPSAPRLTAQAMEKDNGADMPAGHRYTLWIELTWTEPENIYDGDPDFDYLIERSPNGRDDWDKNFRHLPIGRISAADYEVAHGETWYYRISASNNRNHEGLGEWSDVASATIRAIAPGDMPYLRPGSRDEDHIEISWDPPEFDGGSAINGYEIQVSTEGPHDESSYSTVTRPSASARTYTHRSLQPKTEYCYRVRARNSVGWGEWTSGTRQCFRSEQTPPLAPYASARPIESTGVNVSWNLPDSGGMTITGFTVEISHDSATWTSAGIVTDPDGRGLTFSHADIRNFLLDGLEFTRAYFRVRAETTTDPGKWSRTVGAVIPPE